MILIRQRFDDGGASGKSSSSVLEDEYQQVKGIILNLLLIFANMTMYMCMHVKHCPRVRVCSMYHGVNTLISAQKSGYFSKHYNVAHTLSPAFTSGDCAYAPE